MNKQEQIEKMANCISVATEYASEICGTPQANNMSRKELAAEALILFEGYINGADFVEWLKNRYREDKLPDALIMSETNLDEALQEYLKGD